MTNIAEQLSQLQTVAPNLAGRDREFALDLIHFYAKRHYLTPKQAPWVGKLIAKATVPVMSAPIAAPVEPVKVDVGNFDGVVALFAKAKEHLKFPKIVLSVAGKTLKLSLAGPKSKHPNTINIVGEGSYPNRVWYGRVTADGQWVPSQSVTPEFTTALVDLLVKFGKTPARVAKEYGLLTGNCCFCNKGLTDPNSTAAGFGPVCAKHYGLTHEWKTAVAKAEAAAVTSVTPVPDVTDAPAFLVIKTFEPTVEETVEVEKCLFCETNPGTLVKNDVKVCVSCANQLEA